MHVENRIYHSGERVVVTEPTTLQHCTLQGGATIAVTPGPAAITVALVDCTVARDVSIEIGAAPTGSQQVLGAG